MLSVATPPATPAPAHENAELLLPALHQLVNFRDLGPLATARPAATVIIVTPVPVIPARTATAAPRAAASCHLIEPFFSLLP